jgi:hypothetical protein
VTTTLHTPQLDALLSTLQTLARGLEITPELPAKEAVKLTSLAKRQRWLLAPTVAMEQSAVRFAKVVLSTALRAGRMATATELVDAMGKGVRAHVLLLSKEGGGGSFRPLTAKYAAWKSRKYPGRPITQASRDLYNSLASVPWKARRR